VDRIKTCLKTVFPDCEPDSICSETRLGDIAGWDSMNSVNLLLELEAAFSVSLLDAKLQEKDHVSDIVSLLARKGVTI